MCERECVCVTERDRDKKTDRDRRRREKAREKRRRRKRIGTWKDFRKREKATINEGLKKFEEKRVRGGR